jgi:hypothetical protein
MVGWLSGQSCSQGRKSDHQLVDGLRCTCVEMLLCPAFGFECECLVKDRICVDVTSREGRIQYGVVERVFGESESESESGESRNG